MLGSINTRHKNATTDEVAGNQVGETIGGMKGHGGVLELGEGDGEGVNRHIEQAISFGQTRSRRQWRDTRYNIIQESDPENSSTAKRIFDIFSF